MARSLSLRFLESADVLSDVLGAHLGFPLFDAEHSIDESPADSLSNVPSRAKFPPVSP